ncbi:MAG TPA: DUF1775 domain-containing protein [Amycolatopsis sp.]|nr:DUF1775 domain-containing protein [Amycolatopsis sp.]
MAHRPTFILRLLAASLTTATILVAFATPAAARVSIVPDHATDGGTQTFAFRLANERPDTASTRLELVFPQDPPVAYVDVGTAPGWTATVTPRPLNPPVQIGGKTISEVAGSMVLAGGSVAPHQFEQFLITMGPLPANGRLTFQATQSYANGDVQQLTGALTPVITFGDVPPPSAAPPAGSEEQNLNGDAQSGLAVRARAPDTAAADNGLPPLTLLWGALGLAIVIVGTVGIRAYRQRRRESTMDHPVDLKIEQTEEEVDGVSR